MIYNATIVREDLKKNMFMINFEKEDIRSDYFETELSDLLLTDPWDNSDKKLGDTVGILYAPSECIQLKYNGVQFGPKKKRCLNTNGPYHS